MIKSKRLLPLDPSITKTPWLWIGTWSMGGEGFGIHDERESKKVLERAARHAITHFDTAGFYAHGRSEVLLSSILKQKNLVLENRVLNGLPMYPAWQKQANGRK